MKNDEKRTLLLGFIEYINPILEIDYGNTLDEIEVDDFLDTLR